MVTTNGKLKNFILCKSHLCFFCSFQGNRDEYSYDTRFSNLIKAAYEQTASEAINQILTKDYGARFAADSRPVYAVGMNIIRDRRTIDEYQIVLCKT